LLLQGRPQTPFEVANGISKSGPTFMGNAAWLRATLRRGGALAPGISLSQL